MFSRPLLQKILLAALIFIIVLFISIEVIYYLFEGQLQHFIENQYVRYLQGTIAIIAGLFGIANFLLTVVPKKVVIERPTVRALLLRLLDNVEHSWVKGILENSIHHAVLLELDKELQPNQVASPWEMMLELPNQAARLLPANYSIEQVFKQEAARSLLILGEPGAGKTTTLLQLTRRLIAEARTDPEQPIPVVFNLSSWAEKQLPLQEWLASELQVKYHIPLDIGTAWLRNHHLLPLLDGLDEVQAGARAACVAAINAFLPNSGGVTGMVVCCRREEYEQLTQHLQLHTAIGLQPLHHETQVAHYVAAGGEHLAGLRVLLEKNEDMRTLATSPLMLSIMSLAYQDMPITELSPDSHNPAQLFDRYLDKMFSRRPAESQRYPKEKALHYLTWLAKQMQQPGQEVFLVERLQPDWMLSRLGYRLLFALFGAIIAMLFVFIFNIESIVIAQKELSLSLESSSVLLMGMLLGLYVAVHRSKIIPIEIRGWSWEKFSQSWQEVFVPLGITTCIIIFLYGLNELFELLLAPLLNELFRVFLNMLFFNLFLAGIEIETEEVNVLKTRMANQGIISSAKNMLQYGTLIGISIGVIVFAIMIVVGFWVMSPTNFIAALFGGILAGFFRFGGGAVMQHFVLRIMLWLEGYTPFNFVGFLDSAARLILLRKVGGGYIFVHRLLLEHLARRSEP